MMHPERGDQGAEPCGTADTQEDNGAQGTMEVWVQRGPSRRPGTLPTTATQCRCLKFHFLEASPKLD